MLRRANPEAKKRRSRRGIGPEWSHSVDLTGRQDFSVEPVVFGAQSVDTSSFCRTHRLRNTP